MKTARANPTIADNPVKLFSNARAWYRVDRRQTLIRLNELHTWYAAVMNLSNEKINQTRESIRDYLLFLLTFITIAESLDTAYAFRK